MKRTRTFGIKKTAAALASVALLMCVFTVTGCDFSDPSRQGERTAISYEAKESAVYSSTAEMVADVVDSVVEINTESTVTQWGMQYIVSGAGSGVIVGRVEDGYYVVTNDHVVDGAKEITVRTRSGTELDATLVATDDSADIAVVEVKCEYELSLATWGNSDDLQIGEDVIAIGNPLGSLGGTVTKGILSAKDRTITVGDYAMTLLQTDTAINPGNSGGGLFNMRGQLIGVVNAKTSDEEVEGICFAIPSNYAKFAYQSLVENGYLEGRAALPVEVAEGTVSTGGINAQSRSVVYVTSVKAGTESGTFQLYDRIYSLNGTVISTVAQYNSALAAIEPGESVTVCVYRGSVTQGFMGNSISFSSEKTEFRITAAQYGA